MPIAKLPFTEIFYVDQAPGNVAVNVTCEVPFFLLHGFSSSLKDNWADTGWIEFLTAAGFRVIALDHRGHGKSQKFYQRTDYNMSIMAQDAIDLLDHLNVEKAHILGYSMGSRIGARITMDHPQRVSKLMLGGNGYGMIEGTGDWTPVHDGLLAGSMDDVTDLRARAFRRFAERTGSDKEALAACILGLRETFSEHDFAQITHQVLIAIGSEDEIAGSGEKLAGIIPNAEFFSIANRDHMRASTDKSFMRAVVEFAAREA